MLYNTNIDKKSKAKKVTDFIRDLPTTVLRSLHREAVRNSAPTVDLETEEGRRTATREIVRNFEQFLGGSLRRVTKR